MFPEGRRRPKGSSATRTFGMICCLAGIVLLAFSGACASVIGPLGPLALIGVVGGMLLVVGSLMWVQAGGGTPTLLFVLIFVGGVVCLLMFALMSDLTNFKGPIN